MVRPFFKPYFKNKFLGTQGEQKKTKRKRLIGPSHVLNSTDFRADQYDAQRMIVASKKTARTPHILIMVELAGGILKYRRAHQGFKYGRLYKPQRGFFTRKHRLKPGDIRPLHRLNTGTKIFNVPMAFNKLKMLARACGTFCKIL
jgi:ribosomal protein L2